MKLKLCAVLFALSTGLCTGQSLLTPDLDSGPASEPTKPIIFDLSAIDKTADPCTDFYQYACGNWKKNNPIPSDQVRWGRFNELSERNLYLLYAELKSATDAPATPLQKKYGDYFAACMNVAQADKLGIKPIEPELAAIAAWSDRKQLAALDVDRWRRFSSFGLFRVAVEQDQKDATQQILGTDQGGLALPDRDYYLADDDRSKKIREQYVAHVTAMFELAGDSAAISATEAADVMRIETALAKGSMSRVDRRDPAKVYHKMTVDQLQALSPNFNWRTFLDGIGLSSVTSLNVSSPGYVEAANTVIGEEGLPAIRSYLRWHALHNTARLLSQPIVDENFNFFSATLQGQKEQTPRWKRCTRMTDNAMGEAVGQDWVQQHFPPAAKDSMVKLVAALQHALGEDIQSLPWMSDATKVEAEKKLDAFRQKIGYPERWRDYGTLAVKRDDLLGNVERSDKFDELHDLSKLGKPVDETEWLMTPPTVNAYYNPAQNDINFPAGILQPPFYSESIDPAVNFGAIGVVIGHEMTHGFDDQGAKYDLHGNVRGWWTPEDQAKFNERTECEAKEYDGFEVAPGQKLNGHLTLGENTADNGGIRIAFQALQETLAAQGAAAEPGYVDGKRDGYTPQQRFFIGFGQVWCQNQTEQMARVLVKVDPHSPGEWRTKGTVQNFDEFGKAFGCKVGQPMMPANSCRVW